jgi:hypothetical protein
VQRPKTHTKLPVDAILPCSIQPIGRTELRSLNGLITTIEKSGMVVDIVVSSYQGNYYLCDGHRRLEVCRHLGITEIDCIVFEGVEPAVGFIWLNRPTKPIKAEAWWNAWAKAAAKDRDRLLVEMPGGTAANIREALEIWGTETAVSIAIKGTHSPGIVESVRLVEGLLVEKKLEPIRPRYKIGNWILNYQMIKLLNEERGRMNKNEARKLREAILKNMEYRRE